MSPSCKSSKTNVVLVNPHPGQGERERRGREEEKKEGRKEKGKERRELGKKKGGRNKMKQTKR